MFKNLIFDISRKMSKKCKVETLKHLSNFSSKSTGTSGNMDCINNQSLSKQDMTSNKITNDIKKLQSPIKSENDKKEYSVIRLPNGLTALLVADVTNIIDISKESDEESVNELSDGESDSSICSDDSVDSAASETKEEKLAACSLTVGVGSFSDPDDIQGLAHFLEHMVFMGSEKFPKENEFDSYIRKIGGSDNASTECEYTTYYFECPDKYMPNSLDIFSQFFISPLMKREAMTREREAVESEFTIALPSDIYRRQQLLMSTASAKNPGGRFVWGNLKTLRDNVTDDHLYESVHHFREKYYSAHRMTLAVQARVDMDTLEQWVVKYFSGIPNNNFESITSQELHGELFDQGKFHKIYYVESITNGIVLELNWHMPPIIHLYKSKPTSCLSWAIGHEGRGSLISYLRQHLWAMELSAGHTEDGLADNQMYTIFTISVALTERGLKNLDKVLNAVFSYIKMLQNHGLDEQTFLENQRIAEIDFRFDEETAAVEHVEFLSDNMQTYPSEDYIRGSELLFEFDHNKINKFLSELTPYSVNISLSKKNHGPDITLDKVEPWFQTKYTSKDIPSEWTSRWENIEVIKQLHFPEPNEYITSDFTILHQGTDDTPTYPERIFSSEIIDIWYKPDTKFKLPLAFIGFQIINKSCYESIIDQTLLSMYISLLDHFLAEELYSATMAHLEYKVEMVDRALVLEVYGFNEKLDILLKKIVNGIKNFNENMNEDLLQAFLEMEKKSQYNNNLKISNLSREIRLKIIMEKYFTSVDKYNVLSMITLDMLENFSRNFFNQVHVKCLVQGNILKENALVSCQDFIRDLKAGELPVAERPCILVHKLPNRDNCCRIMSFNLKDSNCETTCYYQMGPGGVKDYCTIDLLMTLMEEPLFDQLRTQEQLGYDVSCTIRDTYGILGFSITVVSQIHKHSIDHIESRITDFLFKFQKKLESMPKEEFDLVAEGLINIKKCSDLHMKEEIKRNWGEVKCEEYAFDRLEREIKILATLNPEDIISFLLSRINPENEGYKKLTVQIVGYNCKNKLEKNTKQDVVEENLPLSLSYNVVKEAENKEDNYFIEDIDDFRALLSVYPKNIIFK